MTGNPEFERFQRIHDVRPVKRSRVQIVSTDAERIVALEREIASLRTMLETAELALATSEKRYERQVNVAANLRTELDNLKHPAKVRPRGHEDAGRDPIAVARRDAVRFWTDDHTVTIGEAEALHAWREANRDRQGRFPSNEKLAQQLVMLRTMNRRLAEQAETTVATRGRPVDPRSRLGGATTSMNTPLHVTTILQDAVTVTVRETEHLRQWRASCATNGWYPSPQATYDELMRVRDRVSADFVTFNSYDRIERALVDVRPPPGDAEITALMQWRMNERDFNTGRFPDAAATAAHLEDMRCGELPQGEDSFTEDNTSSAVRAALADVRPRPTREEVRDLVRWRGQNCAGGVYPDEQATKDWLDMLRTMDAAPEHDMATRAIMAVTEDIIAGALEREENSRSRVRGMLQVLAPTDEEVAGICDWRHARRLAREDGRLPGGMACRQHLRNVRAASIVPTGELDRPVSIDDEWPELGQ